MTTRDIPRPEWSAYLDRLSRLHTEDPITVEIMRPDIGAQMQLISRPLEGMFAEERRGAWTITIAAGSRPNDHIAHVISDPIRLRVLSNFTGDDSVVEIESGDDSKTLVHFNTSH